MSIINTTDENFENHVLKNKKPVLTDFWASWCAPCLQLAPILEEIAKEMCSNWDILVAIDHRLGKVDIGEESLIVAVGSPHRQSAFEAASYSVDRIKQTVPIWKKEHFEGGEVWIGDADGFRPLEHKSG